MKSSFNELGISPPILKAIEDMGFETPTEVQSKAIPHILKQEDLIVMSKTGSGKTAVFGVSMLQLTDPEAPGPQGLILTPTRELAVQVDSNLKQMSKYLQHKTTAVYGQHSMNVEIQALKKGVSIVTGTPGRVFDHIRHGNLITKHIRFLVLDEADRMLDMGFIDQVVRIIRALPRNRVTLLFSATIPDEVRRICRDHMKNPTTIEIESQTKTVDAIQQVYYRVERDEKRTQLNRLLLIEQPESCMIFCNTRMAVDQVQSFLTRKGYASQALHGDIPQGKRLKTIQQFKQGEFHILVATDVAARGIHIDGLSLVINYDVPVEKDSYVHRIGRTGRAGNDGRAISLVTGDDIMSLYAIEEHIGAMIEEGELPSEAVFKECKASAKKWIEENSLKAEPPRTSLESKANGSQKRHSHSRSPQPHEKHSRRPNEANGDQKAVKRDTPKAHAEHAKPPIRGERVKPPVHGNQTRRPSQSPHKPMPPRSNEKDVMRTGQNTEVVQNRDSAPKKSFFQRLLQRIFGK
ncbi:MAG: DEAD/DEAH box helicase [Clostridia bacterium]|nr:DEAD/DEAH box helicase [Clostridia bacterium]